MKQKTDKIAGSRLGCEPCVLTRCTVIINNAADDNGAQLNIKLEITDMFRGNITCASNRHEQEQNGEYFYHPGYNGV
jgi:hypothetical protein